MDSDSGIRWDQVQSRSLFERCSYNPHLFFDGRKTIAAVCKLVDIELNVLGCDLSDGYRGDCVQ